MNSKKLYRDYFNIDPKYYAAVTADLIKSGEVKWTSFYPHETFVKLLEKTHTMLSGKDRRSLWVEGAYGTGKSHAALTIKSMLEASDDEIRAYFKDYGLREDLCQQLITDKNNGKLITIHRIGSASIRSDQDLILALQDSITAALKEHNITNRGETSLKKSALRWLEDKEANRSYFDNLIHEDKYMWYFGGKHVDEVISLLKDSTDETVIAKYMRNILKVAEDNGITALRLDIPAMCNWIKSIIDENDISAILFVWDEFTEYFHNNQNALTGFQTLAEISESCPFYFLIVTHESSSLIQDKDMRKKILNRFVGDVTVRIEMPENIAFQLMAQAMKTSNDPVLKEEWTAYKGDLNAELSSIRKTIIDSAKKHSTMGQKTVISDAELQSIVPLHPYAALLLKHMSVAFNSNARSMFDFIISNDMTDAKGFKWFINNYGPLDKINLLTIDMLWDFFTGKDQNGLNDDVRIILDSFGLLKKDSLNQEQERVFKTALLLEAISLRVGDVELLRPNEQNIDLAFMGTDWSKGKASRIAAGLCQEQGLLFEKPVGRGLKEYTVANRDGDINKINKLKDDIHNNTKTYNLIVDAELISAVQPPIAIRSRFVMKGAASYNLTSEIKKLNEQNQPNRFKTVVTFALNDTEASTIHSAILKAIVQSSNELFYIECLTPMGDDLLNQYVENMAYSKNYAQNDRQRATGFEAQAKKCLTEWKQKISDGAFMLYTPEYKNGIRAANLAALHEELQKINRQIYFCGLEQFNLIDNMFLKGPLAQGAECGITEELKSTFKSSNVKTSLATALEGAWKVKRYWEDPTKKSLPIVRIKQKVEKVIRDGFQEPSGRISILSIYEALEEAPYGFMPNNVTAFIIGFVLKEYATSDYFWSNGLSSENMTLDKMKKMIANAINQKYSPSPKYKEEYIVAMSANQRSFLQCTSTAFQIPMSQCGSIESARDQIRIKMKGLAFPIWCLKYILNTVQLETTVEQITTVIDAYCGIANTANSNEATESDLADRIGSYVHDNAAIIRDMENLLTNEMCRKGMLAYIDIYQDGVLPKLAQKINDGGAYLDQVKSKFNADAANWVWNSVTADEKIADVILEYRIIAESNKSLPKCTNLQDMVLEWNKRSNNIRMAYDVLHKYVGDLKLFLVQLYDMKQHSQLREQNKQQFYDALMTQRESFEQFYKDQLPYFKQIADTFVEELDEPDIAEFYNTISAGQFTKSSTEYFQYIENTVNSYKKSIRKTQLMDLWFKKTGTKDPADWSEKYNTPILCMFNDMERGETKSIFDTILVHAAEDADIDKAIDYLKKATFYDRLKDSQEQDRCFMERIVGDYAIMLNDANAIRKSLRKSIQDRVYNWMDNSTVNNRLKMLAEKQYKLGGCERAQAIIDKMDAAELRRYLNDLIADNLKVGMEILKNK